MLKNRVVIDTNLWISFLISDNLSELRSLIKSKEIIILFSEELLNEFLAIVARPKFKKYFSRKNIEQILESFEDYGELIPIKSDIKKCRDPKDNFILNLALDGKANYLLTGDEDLLILKKIGKTKIIKYHDFIEKFN